MQEIHAEMISKKTGSLWCPRLVHNEPACKGEGYVIPSVTLICVSLTWS